MSFKLRIPLADIPHWSARYEYSDALPTELGPVAKRRGHLTKTEFLAFARWKTVRTQKRCQANPPEFVKTVTAASLRLQTNACESKCLRCCPACNGPPRQ